MEVNQSNLEINLQRQNPWATGSYSPIVEVSSLSEESTDLNKEVDEETEEELEDGIQDGVQKPITEKVVGEVVEEGEEGESVVSENIHAIVTAKKLKEEGWIDAEDIPEDIDYPQIYELYKNTAKERLLQEVQNEVNQTLTAVGINEHNISILAALENEVPLDEISEISRYKKYTKLNPADTPDDKKLQVIKERFKSIGLGDKDLERQIDAIESSQEIDEAFMESQQYFESAVKEFDKVQTFQAQEALRRDQEIKQRNQAILDKALRLGEIANQKLTADQQKDLQKAIYDRSVVVEIDNRQFSFSPFEEFLYKMNNDFEFQLSQFKTHLFNDKDIKKIKEIAKREATSDDWDAVRKAQMKAGQKASIKKGEQTTQTIHDNRSGFTMEIPINR